MTGADDRDPRVAELMERHTPQPSGGPDWRRVGKRRAARGVRGQLLAGSAIAVAASALVAGIIAAPKGAEHGASAGTSELTGSTTTHRSAPPPGKAEALPPIIEGWLRDGVLGGRSIQRQTLRRMVAIETPDGEWGIWLARDSEGDSVEMVVDPRIGGGSQGGGGPVPCQLTQAHPFVRICGTGPGHAYGRVAERVTRISGADRTAVGNGWFLAIDDGRQMNAPPPREIVGYDADGTPLEAASGVG